MIALLDNQQRPYGIMLSGAGEFDRATLWNTEAVEPAIQEMHESIVNHPRFYGERTVVYAPGADGDGYYCYRYVPIKRD